MQTEEEPVVSADAVVVEDSQQQSSEAPACEQVIVEPMATDDSPPAVDNDNATQAQSPQCEETDGDADDEGEDDGVQQQQAEEEEEEEENEDADDADDEDDCSEPLAPAPKRSIEPSSAQAPTQPLDQHQIVQDVRMPERRSQALHTLLERFLDIDRQVPLITPRMTEFFKLKGEGERRAVVSGTSCGLTFLGNRHRRPPAALRVCVATDARLQGAQDSCRAQPQGHGAGERRE